MARGKRAGCLGELPRIKEQQILRSGTKIHAERDLWRDRFRPESSREDAIRFMDNLKMICIVTHVADARTCVLHPASHTHRQLTDEQLIEAGVAPDLIRLSVGIENANDIIADIKQALK